MEKTLGAAAGGELRNNINTLSDIICGCQLSSHRSKRAGILIRHGRPCREIQPQVANIVLSEINQDRKRGIAETMCNDFSRLLSVASSEGDCFEPVHRALSTMDCGRKLDFPRKEGIVAPIALAYLLSRSTYVKPGTEPEGLHQDRFVGHELSSSASYATTSNARPPTPPQYKHEVFPIKIPRWTLRSVFIIPL